MSQIAANTGAPEAGEERHDQIVRAVIAEVSHIATLPEVTLKIIRLVEDPESTAQDLNNVISNDPALGARVLKVVNSAFYGLPGQIASINRAIVLLGLNAVKNIAVAASLAKLFRGGQVCPAFNARDLWTHSVAVATATRLLANKAGLGLPDEAFLAGLIHDLGIMVEVQVRRSQFVKAIDAVADGSGALREAELANIGANHEEFGAGLCQTWKFPMSFVYVTGYHHRPWELAPEHRPLTSLVHLADILSANNGLGFAGTVETDDYSPEILSHLGLTNGDLEQTATEMPEAMEEAVSLLQESG